MKQDLHNPKSALITWPLVSIVTLLCVIMPTVFSGAQETTGTLPAGLAKMSTAADPAFEVATIKPSPPGGSYPSINTHLRDLSVTNASVMDLIKWAYRLRDEQVKGGPPWISETKFDIIGQPDSLGQASPDQDRLMMRKLLADRFHLIVHETQHVSSVYALSIRDGHPAMVQSRPPEGHNRIYLKKLDNGTTEIQFSFTTMQDFLYVLMDSIKDRQIVDETGLKGEYNFTLVLPSPALEDNVDPGDLSAGLFKAIESIGLQLRPKKTPVQILVIDHLDEPTPN